LPQIVRLDAFFSYCTEIWIGIQFAANRTCRCFFFLLFRDLELHPICRKSYTYLYGNRVRVDGPLESEKARKKAARVTEYLPS
jgi:hypothetical protein